MMRAGEMIRSQTVGAVYERDAVSFTTMSALLGSAAHVGESRNEVATVIDLHRTPTDFSDQDILEAVSRHLSAPLGNIGTVQESPDDRERYEELLGNINLAIVEARNYLEGVLSMRLPSQIHEVKVNSRQDIIDLIRKTSRYGITGKSGLEVHAAYCALVSVTLAVFELQKEAAHLLEIEMMKVEVVLTQPSEINEYAPLFSKKFAVLPDAPITVTINGAEPRLTALLSMRDKKPDSQITKYLTRPESNVQEALKDAIGVRVEIANERIEEALILVVTFLQKYLAADGLKIEDRYVLAEHGEQRLLALKEGLATIPGIKSEVTVTAATLDDDNPFSAQSFRVVKVLANIMIPGTDRIRSIEFQIVEPESRNEKKLSGYPIYELKKKITVMTRLFGGCSQSWMKKQLAQISDADGYAEKIIDELRADSKDRFLISLTGTGKYAAASVYDRWLRVPGLITNRAHRKQIGHALGLIENP